MQTITERSRELPHDGYYTRTSQESSLAAFVMAIFATLGGLTLGGLVTLFFDGLAVWIATGIGMLGGILVYSMCYVAGHASLSEEEEATCRRPKCKVHHPQEASSSVF